MRKLRFVDIIQKNQLLAELFRNPSWWEDYYKYISLQSNLKDITDMILKARYVADSVKTERNVTIKGPVVILDDCEIWSGSYIIGPVLIACGCKIGPNCFIDGNSIIGKNVHVGQGAEIKCSIIMDRCKIFHFSYTGHSIIGRNVNVGAGVITAVRRFDNSIIKIRYRGEEIDSKRGKFGAIIGDNVQIGIGVKILEGRVIKPNTNINPNQLVDKNIV